MTKRRLIPLLLLFAGTARAEGAADLPVNVEVKLSKTAEQELGKIERALKAQPNVTTDDVPNLTLPLQSVVEDQLGKGPVTIYPRAIFTVALKALQAHVVKSAIAQQLATYQERGKFSEVDKEDAAPMKRVASFVFDRDRVASPDPHLPDTVRSRPGMKVKGTYLICVGTDGKVTKVTVVQSIAGADQAIQDHLKSTWVYKPQPVPVCSPRTFIFEIN
jgi:hypothetical protein